MGLFMSEGGVKMMGKWGFSTVFFFRKTEDFSRLMRETAVKIILKDKDHHKTSRTHNFSIKNFLEGYKKNLTTILYGHYTIIKVV